MPNAQSEFMYRHDAYVERTARQTPVSPQTHGAPHPIRCGFSTCALALLTLILTGCVDILDPLIGKDPNPIIGTIHDQHVQVNDTLTLEAPISSDEPSIETTWEVVDGPAGADAVVTKIDAFSAEFETDIEGAHFLRWTVVTTQASVSKLVTIVALDEPLARELSVTVSGVPKGTAAVAVTDHGSLAHWLRGNERITSLPTGRYSVVAGPVTHGGTVFLAEEPVLSVALGEGEVREVTVTYQPAVGHLFEVPPDFARCEPGRLTDAAKRRALDRLNFVRALTGVPSVLYDESRDADVQQAAMIYALNTTNPQPHDPPLNAVCYSEEGAEGSSSNLGRTWSTNPESVRNGRPEEHVDRWFRDANVMSLGHRRWNLDPFMPDTAFGMTYGSLLQGPYSQVHEGYTRGAALSVAYGEWADLSHVSLPFIAFPRGEFPRELLATDFRYSSFSVMRPNMWSEAEAIDYTNATVHVTDSTGNDIPVSDVSNNHHLQWHLAEAMPGETYLVSIHNVVIDGTPTDYAYTFTMR